MQVAPPLSEHNLTHSTGAFHRNLVGVLQVLLELLGATPETFEGLLTKHEEHIDAPLLARLQKRIDAAEKYDEVAFLSPSFVLDLLLRLYAHCVITGVRWWS